jgi:transposase
MDEDTTAERELRSAPEVLGEIMPGLERRRRWSTKEKLRILAQSAAPGSSPAVWDVVARAPIEVWPAIDEPTS